jgi:hypothetical protein
MLLPAAAVPRQMEWQRGWADLWMYSSKAAARVEGVRRKGLEGVGVVEKGRAWWWRRMRCRVLTGGGTAWRQTSCMHTSCAPVCMENMMMVQY